MRPGEGRSFVKRIALIRRAPFVVLMTALLVTLPSSEPQLVRIDMTGGRLVPVRRAGATDDPPAPAARVALRQLVIATDETDVGLMAWRTVLDRIGTPYDVVLAHNDRLAADRLVRPDGVGRYSAVLLTSSSLLFQKPGGGYVSALDAAEWNAVWGYERVFRVRQVTINGSPGTSPEDYCLRARGEGAIGTTPVPAVLTDGGAVIFDYLRPDARLPIANSYLYYSTVEPQCGAQPVLTVGSDVLGVLSTAPDGRERLALTITLGTDSAAIALLGFGLLRWATRGGFLGEQRHWINVDVDDWFLTTARRHPDGTGDTFRLTGPEAAAVDQQQTDLRTRFSPAAGFTLNLPFNGSMLNQRAPAQCDTAGTPDALTSYSLCLAGRFRWINHTLTHPKMNETSYDKSYHEIAGNLTVARAAGLPVPAAVLKPPEYSGLGVYSPDPESDDQPTDHGLEGSNRELLAAASDLGVKYLHGNMSFASHRPPCFNCGIHPPLHPDLLVVPDWPTNISYAATTPDEATSFYNAIYGQNGTSRFRTGRDLDYQQIVDSEADVALQHVMSGSVYAHTLHQGNLHEYAPGSSLTFDWLNALLTRYSAYYTVPLQNPDWVALAVYVEARTAHFAALAAGQDAVWDRMTNAVTYTPSAHGPLFLTGLATRLAIDSDTARIDESQIYGSDSVSRVGLTGGETVTFTAKPRP